MSMVSEPMFLAVMSRLIGKGMEDTKEYKPIGNWWIPPDATNDKTFGDDDPPSQGTKAPVVKPKLRLR